MSAKTRLWILGTAVICGALVLFGLLGGLLPQLSAASSTSSLAQSAESQNEVQRTQVQALQAAEKRMPELSQELEALRAAIPDTADSADFVRELAELEASTGARIAKFEVKPPIEDRGAGDGSTAGAAPAAEGATADTAESADAAAPPADASVPAVVGPLAIPFELEFIGSVDQVTAFVRGLQNGARLVEVNGTAIVSVPVTDDAAGAPESGSAGASKLIGRLFVQVK